MIARTGGNLDFVVFLAARPGKPVIATMLPAVYCRNLRRVSLLLFIEDNSIAFRPELKDELLLGYFWVWPDFLFILAFEEIGFFWGRKAVHFHNPFVKKRLRSFWAFNEIGFVYSDYEIIFFSVIPC